MQDPSSYAAAVARQCFSVVQSKRFGPSSTVAESTLALCPSMDLLTLGLERKRLNATTRTRTTTSSLSPPLWLHRSLSFQRLATISSSMEEEDTSKDTDDKVEEEENDDEEEEDARKWVVWSPDGRWLALVTGNNHHHHHLTLYHVEALATLSSSSSSSSSEETSALFPSSLSASSAFVVTAKDKKYIYQSYQLAKSGNVVLVQLLLQSPQGKPHQRGGREKKHSVMICGLTWSHVGQWHPLLERRDMEKDDNDDDDNNEAPTGASHLYRKLYQRYADRQRLLLPASEYHDQQYGGSGGGGHGAGAPACVIPSSQTPLSVLVVATVQAGLELYLNGRYRIASGISYASQHDNESSVGRSVTMACSNDLAHILVATSSGSYSLITIPPLAEQRYTFQTLTALYSSIMGHLNALPVQLTDVLESWKSSLKPMDLKLENLARLLRNYGLLSLQPSSTTGGSGGGVGMHNTEDARIMRQHFVRYILSGHTAGSADLSNAMDQFFTNVQMNDQLIQRMERSLTVAIANVESQLRKTIAAVQALTLETDQLGGLARASSDFIPAIPALKLQEHCQALYAVMESALTCLVDARFRLRDWIAWLRATGSLIKARGTAANSVQRDNAKKRRVPDDTVRRILRYLQQETNSEGSASKTAAAAMTSSGLCETLLGIHLSRHWEDHGNDSDPPSSPKSVFLDGGVVNLPFTANNTIPCAFKKTLEAAQDLFELPAASLKDCIQRLDFELLLPLTTEGRGSNAVVAVTTRLGDGGLARIDIPYGEDAPTGFFNPLIRNLDNVEFVNYNVRQWSISAQAIPQSNNNTTLIQIRAVPLPWYTVCTSHPWNIHDHNAWNQVDGHAAFSWYVDATLQLPAGYRVVELAFYGDNGKSGLFSGTENGTGMERRQALATLVRRNGDEDSCCVLEMWLIPYDLALWYRGDLHVSHKKAEPFLSNSVVFFEPIPEISITELIAVVSGEDDESEEGVLKCKSRRVCTFDSAEKASSARFVLSGSRGIAAVSTWRPDGTLLEIFDMEEDEEVDDGDGGMEEE